MSVITAQWSSGLFRVINVRGNRVLIEVYRATSSGTKVRTIVTKVKVATS